MAESGKPVKIEKVRIDQLVTDLGIAPSKSVAQALIMSGKIKCDGQLTTKCGTKVSAASSVELIAPPIPYVSRGGLKLEKALNEFPVAVENTVCIDAGASTGGFTDCLLQRGAAKVYAVDVGYGQISLKLRNDPRVVVIEKCNVRYLAEDQVPEKADIITADLSFISLDKVAQRLKGFLKPGGYVIPLVKPQFETERKHLKKGVVKDDGIRQKAVEKVENHFKEIGFEHVGTTRSPIEGPDGNVEFLCCFRLPS
ncbi:MAG: TlyA family RNA methyltransferase [Firmicutes bacterium]|nr:TlyA family RNA methyltransferase [Bacillota bacterium]